MSHAKLGPSNHRWPHCPGSIREEAVYPYETNPAAIAGTGTHLLLELCIVNKCVKPTAYANTVIGEGHRDKPQGWTVDQFMLDRVQIALDYIWSRATEIGATEVVAESQSNPGFWFGRDDWWGTCDVTLIGGSTIECIDYKDGRMYVSEKENPQFIAYGYGKLAPFLYHSKDITVQPDLINCPIKTTRLTVIQPKTSNPVRFVEMTPIVLYTKASALNDAAKLTEDINAPLICGDWCTWCKHGRAGNCIAKSQAAAEGVKNMTTTDGSGSVFEMLQSGQLAPGTMTNDQLAEIKDAMPLIVQLGNQVDAEIEKRLLDGQEVPRYKIGTGRGSKAWIDSPEVVEKKLKGMRLKKGDLYPSKLISCAQALKFPGLTKRQIENIEKMIEVKPGKQTVVKSNQKTADQMFSLNFM